MDQGSKLWLGSPCIAASLVLVYSFEPCVAVWMLLCLPEVACELPRLMGILAPAVCLVSEVPLQTLELNSSVSIHRNPAVCAAGSGTQGLST